MTNENKPELQTEQKVKWVRSPQGVFATYSNQTHLSWSLDDVRLRFAEIGQSDESLTPGDTPVSVNFEKASITISWRNAKILHFLLGQIIGNYEKVNGEINLRPTLASNEGT